ncbi:MAG: NAD(P)H-hydrate dehydratase [Betaproteobacteria bacterium]|nr:NAD(P)H-hydrate dehydratase [Betaproteobacteria bacterium]
MSHALLRTGPLRRFEAEALAACPPGALMDRAGQAVASAAARIARQHPRGATIHLLVGPGNNGGDALIAGLTLHDRGFPVRAWLLSPAAPSASDALRARQRWQTRGLPLHPLADFPAAVRAPGSRHAPALVIDGLFGIGLTRALDPSARAAARAVAAAGAFLLSIDIPSGLDADTGAVVGGDPGGAFRADLTLSLLADKPGLRTGHGPALAGEVRVDPLGVLTAPPADGQLLDQAMARGLMRPRSPVSHKGSFGAVVVIGGGHGLQGAAVLAATAAQAIGAGKVWLACPEPVPLAGTAPQLMSRSFDAPADDVETVVIGCGLGMSEAAARRLGSALGEARACVVDADALNRIAADPALAQRLRARPGPTVLTPHPLEAARLLGAETAEVQSDRVGAALRLAGRHRAVVLLKGAGTIIASPCGRWAINTTGSPALATGGTGDVLAGLIGGLLAQSYPAWEAACLGAWLHGRAADLWRLDHPHGAGLNPARLPGLLPGAWPATEDPHDAH